MRRITVTLGLLALAVMIAAGSPAHARAYVGASFIQTDSEFDVALDNFDPDDSGYKIFGGFNFIRFVGVEASYRDLGTFQESGMTSSVDADIEAFDVSARGMLPLGLVTLFARAGYANISFDGTLDVGGSVTDFNEDDWELFYGVGIEFGIGSHFGIRAEWETYDVDDDLNSLSAGAYFRF